MDRKLGMLNLTVLMSCFLNICSEFTESSDTIIDYGSGHIIHDLLFTGNLDDGHYSILKNKSDRPISIIPVKRLKCVGKIYPVADSNGAQNEIVVLEVKRPKRHLDRCS